MSYFILTQHTFDNQAEFYLSHVINCVTSHKLNKLEVGNLCFCRNLLSAVNDDRRNNNPYAFLNI